MSIFAGMNMDNVETQKDSVGGFSPLESDIYPAVIKTVYITVSKSGAMAANLVADVAGREYREQLWITNSKGEYFFVNKKTGNKVALPGCKTLDDLCICAVGQPLKELDTEERVFKIYDFDAKQEVNKSVPTIVDLMGKEVYLAIFKEVVDKNVKNDSGEYIPSGETREVNVIDKVFHLGTKKTVNEAKDGVAEATFFDKWLAKNKNIVRNKAKGAGSDNGTKGAPQKPAAPKKSLFG